MMRLLIALALLLSTVALGLIVYYCLFAVYVNYYFFKTMEVIGYAEPN